MANNPSFQSQTLSSLFDASCELNVDVWEIVQPNTSWNSGCVKLVGLPMAGEMINQISTSYMGYSVWHLTESAKQKMYICSRNRLSIPWLWLPLVYKWDCHLAFGVVKDASWLYIKTFPATRSMLYANVSFQRTLQLRSFCSSLFSLSDLNGTSLRFCVQTSAEQTIKWKHKKPYLNW